MRWKRGREGRNAAMPELQRRDVIFYWRPGCGFCSALRRNLLAQGVELDERNIWEDQQAASFVRSVANGHETVPTVVVGDHALVNPRPAKVLSLLRR